MNRHEGVIDVAVPSKAEQRLFARHRLRLPDRGLDEYAVAHMADPAPLPAGSASSG